MLKIITATIVSLTLVGCMKPADYQPSTNNPEFKVERLFEHEGCQAYWFWDNRAVYYVVCNGKTVQTARPVSCGKGCSRMETVSTTSGARAVEVTQ